MDPVQDPLGLADRDMRDAGVAYQTFVADAEALDAFTTSWYETYREAKGEPGSPALSDKHHGYWRGISREAVSFGFTTLRQAYRDAWPIPAELEPPGGNPSVPAGEIRRLIPQRQYFIKDGGERFTAIEASSFLLYKRYLTEGWDAILPVVRQRRDCGFNMHRVWSCGHWDDPYWRFHPNEYPNYYPEIRPFFERMAAEGAYVEWTVLLDPFRTFPGGYPEMQEHYRRCEDAIDGQPNALWEVFNENDAVGQCDPSQFWKPRGVVSSHGSNGSQTMPVAPYWDYCTFHTNAAPEEQRKVGHNAWEIDPGRPILTNETSRFPEVGMWVWGAADLARQKMLAFDSAAGAALLCAGSCFHSVNGKLAQPWNAQDEEVARAWAAGARSVPLEFQNGRYERNDDLGPDELRKYRRILGDGRAYEVVIHK